MSRNVPMIIHRGTGLSIEMWDKTSDGTVVVEDYRIVRANKPHAHTPNWRWYHRLWLLTAAGIRYVFKGEIYL